MKQGPRVLYQDHSWRIVANVQVRGWEYGDGLQVVLGPLSIEGSFTDSLGQIAWQRVTPSAENLAKLISSILTAQLQRELDAEETPQ